MNICVVKQYKSCFGVWIDSSSRSRHRSGSGRVASLTLWIATAHMGFRSCRQRNDGSWVMVSLPVRAQSVPDPSPTGLHQTREPNRKEGTHSTLPRNRLSSLIPSYIFGRARLGLKPHTTALLLQNTTLLNSMSMPMSPFHAGGFSHTVQCASMQFQTLWTRGILCS